MDEQTGDTGNGGELRESDNRANRPPSDNGEHEPGDSAGNMQSLSDVHGIDADLVLRAVDAADNMICVVDMQQEDQPLIFVNDYFCRYLGYHRDDIIGRNCRFLQYNSDDVRDEDQPQIDRIREALASGEHCTVQLRNYKSNGEQFINELYLSPVANRAGAVTHFIGVQNDVTKRAKLQTELRRQTRRLRTTFDAMPSMVGLVRWNNDRWEHVMVSQRLAQYLNISQDDCRGKSFHQIGYPDEMARRIEKLVSSGRDARASANEERELRRTRFNVEIEGEVRTLEIRSDCVAIDPDEISFEEKLLQAGNALEIGETDIDLWSYVAEDVTEWLRARAELQDAHRRFDNVQMIEQQRIARDLHDGTAQEILAMSLQAKALRKKYEVSEIPPEIRTSLLEELRTIQDCAQRANARMRRAIRGLLPAEVESVGLTQSISRLVEEMQRGGEDKPRYRFEIVSRVTPLNYEQSVQLYRITVEALANARRHADATKVVVRIGTDSGDDATQVGDLAFIEVEDNGRGIERQTVQSMNLGVGLESMLIRSVRASGGLSVRSQLGRGTIVRCDFELFPEQGLSDRETGLDEESRIEFSNFDD